MGNGVLQPLQALTLMVAELGAVYRIKSKTPDCIWLVAGIGAEALKGGCRCGDVACHNDCNAVNAMAGLLMPAE